MDIGGRYSQVSIKLLAHRPGQSGQALNRAIPWPSAALVE
jgi:hypothetical protein